MRQPTSLVRSVAAVIASAGLITGLTGLQPAAADTTVTAVKSVNIRSGPSTNNRIVGTLRRGENIRAVSAGNGWTKVKTSSGAAYVSSKYLAKGKTTSGSIQASAATVTTVTASVNLRKGPGTSYKVIKVVRKGSKVTLTGIRKRGFSPVSYGKANGWISNKYLAQPAPVLPPVTGFRYATADLVVRTTSGADYKRITVVKTGTKLSITGTVQNGRAQIIYNKAVRWVTAKYLSATDPTAGSGPVAPGTYPVEKGLKPNAIKLHRASRAAFPQITTYYGVRPDAIPDHPSGLALDLMIPDYKSATGKALGAQVAAWAQANQATLGVHYIIWNQHIWNYQRASEGWRVMGDRGSDSANHKDHVHITVLP